MVFSMLACHDLLICPKHKVHLRLMVATFFFQVLGHELNCSTSSIFDQMVAPHDK